MKSPLKVGILILILVFPVLIYFFLENFGTNKYTIPVYYEEVVPEKIEGCSFSEGQFYVPDFNFTTSDNSNITEKMLEGNITVATFFYTDCPDVCPTVFTELTRVQSAFGKLDYFKILSVTIDPEKDTPSLLNNYASRFEAKPSTWLFLTGNKEKIVNFAQCGLILPMNKNGNQSLPQLDQLVLIDKQKRIRGYYTGTDREEMDRLIIEINILLEED